MTPTWLKKQIGEKIKHYSGDLGLIKARAMAHCWSNKWLLGVRYSDAVHEIIDKWNCPRPPKWSNRRRVLDNSNDISNYSWEDALREDAVVPVISSESPRGVKATTASPQMSMKKDIKREALIFSSSPSHRCEVENIKTVCGNVPHGDLFILEGSGSNKSSQNSNDKGVMLALVDPIKFVPENLDKCCERQSTEVKKLDPVSACYSLAKRLRKKLNFREYMEALGEYRTNLYMDGKRVADARNGNKKTRRLKCAVQALAQLSMDEKIKPVILDCLRKRNSFVERMHFPNTPISGKAMSEGKSISSKNEVGGKGILHQRWKKGYNRQGEDADLRKKWVNGGRYGPKNPIALLHIYAKRTKPRLKLQFLFSSKHPKIGEKITVCIKLEGIMIGKGVDNTGKFSRAKLRAAADAVAFLEVGSYESQTLLKAIKTGVHPNFIPDARKAIKKCMLLGDPLSNPALRLENKGRDMLLRLGWEPNQGLGKDKKSGRLQPITYLQPIRTERHGLGYPVACTQLDEEGLVTFEGGIRYRLSQFRSQRKFDYPRETQIQFTKTLTSRERSIVHNLAKEFKLGSRTVKCHPLETGKVVFVYFPDFVSAGQI